MWIVVFAVTAIGAVIALWYGILRRHSRRRSLQVMHWIESSLGGHGRILDLTWDSPSHLRAQLWLSPEIFQQVAAEVQLTPREWPLPWLLARLRQQQEIVTFRADFNVPPDFDLDVHNHRWWGRTCRKQRLGWETERSIPFMIVTKPSWQSEISPIVEALLVSRDREFIRVSFQKRSPHFLASLPVEAVAPAAASRCGLLDVLSELAGSASASRL